jgi:alanine dehydrogenase
LVDLSIDQGGCFETSRPTTHADPTYTVDGVIHYCVANVPGAVPGTSTIALENAILPYVKTLAEGWREAVRSNRHLANGLNIDAGAVLHPVVAEATRRQLQTFSEIRSGGPA